MHARPAPSKPRLGARPRPWTLRAAVLCGLLLALASATGAVVLFALTGPPPCQGFDGREACIDAAAYLGIAVLLGALSAGLWQRRRWGWLWLLVAGSLISLLLLQEILHSLHWPGVMTPLDWVALPAVWATATALVVLLVLDPTRAALRPLDRAAAWPARTAFALGLASGIGPVALLVALWAWRASVTNPLLAIAHYAGWFLALPALCFGAVALLRGSLKRRHGAAMLVATLAFACSVVAFSVMFLAVVPERGVHVGPGSCEDGNLRATLIAVHPGSEEGDPGSLEFQVASRSGPLGSTDYMEGQVRSAAGRVSFIANWSVDAGNTTVFFAKPLDPLPDGPWESFTITYREDDGFAQVMRCDISGDGAPEAFLSARP